MTLKALVEALMRGSIWTEFIANTREPETKGLTIADSNLESVEDIFKRCGNEKVHAFEIKSKRMIWIQLELSYDEALKKYWR